jgi:Fic family protein
MEPLFAAEGQPVLSELSKQIFLHAGRLGGQIPAEITRRQIAGVVRMMNSYYSNLIEGHKTFPKDIELALKQDFSTNPVARDNQWLNIAHIAVEKKIEEKVRGGAFNACATDFLSWIHRGFFEQLPASLRISHTKLGKPYEIIPGEIRGFNVDVGRHTPIDYHDLPRFLAVFEQQYDTGKMPPTRRLTAIAAAHHRFVWIHPFGDGNGRVARLFSHALLLQEEIGGYGLWTLSRGLARNQSEYFERLNNADLPRVNDWDGRGNLSERYLVEFCEFFLKTILDQIQFMEKILRLSELENGIAYYVSRVERVFGKNTEAGRRLLTAVLHEGELPRGAVATVTGKGETAARKILQAALTADLLVSNNQKSPVRLAFPAKVLTAYFSGLYVESP